MNSTPQKIVVNINDQIYVPLLDPTHPHNLFEYSLPNDFIQSTNKKYVVIKKVRLFNNEGQLDMGGCLCSNLASECCYNYGLGENQNYIMSVNELNEKVFEIKSEIKTIQFWFCDYKGIKLCYSEQGTVDLTEGYYYVIEMELVY